MLLTANKNICTFSTEKSSENTAFAIVCLNKKLKMQLPLNTKKLPRLAL
jgi:hypothetical protein